MSDVRDLLERGVGGFEPSGDALERTLRRVRSRQRRRRIGTAVVALGITAGIVAGLWAAFLGPESQEQRAPAGPTPAETEPPAETEACPPPPFVATVVPEGFSSEATPADVRTLGGAPGSAVAYKGEPGRSISIRRLAMREEPAWPLTQEEPITVAGSEGVIGDIHEGFAVHFRHGSDSCNLYVIQGYGVSLADLRAFAEGLRPG